MHRKKEYNDLNAQPKFFIAYENQCINGKRKNEMENIVTENQWKSKADC